MITVRSTASFRKTTKSCSPNPGPLVPSSEPPVRKRRHSIQKGNQRDEPWLSAQAHGGDCVRTQYGDHDGIDERNQRNEKLLDNGGPSHFHRSSDEIPTGGIGPRSGIDPSIDFFEKNTSVNIRRFLIGGYTVLNGYPDQINGIFTISRGKRNQIHQQRRYFTFTSSWHKNCNMSYVRSNYTTNEKEHNMSNVFKRMGDIMTANISSALDKWEDPRR